MKLAVSNIAWAPAERDLAYALLAAHGVRGLEIAPALFFDGAADPFQPRHHEAERALAAARVANLELVSMQSLLFNVEGAALFQGADAHDRFCSAMLRAIDLAGRFSIGNLVFGSPRQRNIPDGMSADVAEGIAVATFRRLGDAAGRAGTKLGIEFNPSAYGTNFLNDVDSAAAFVARVDHAAVTLILDLGAMHMNDEFDRIDDVVASHAGRISHVHLSEPNLAPAPASVAQAAQVISVMTKAGYSGWYSIEMKPQPEHGLAALDQALGRLVEAAMLADERPC
ncbi:sugar phosphate isomerase/epimerase [Rhodopseudomonas sp. HC1]|uniref:sugar phosphate isomerase/epimerase family protein n=1 Tax=Rhodopseudomonas infernalis TaxID=2897386 RepID=UPI001EE8DD89|nr:TIM barrel protein [Rhodopseudomonas infernalis]MCG6206875.1 sugar phosphate isomerase/epimerase [Rhodopseudomonas infernalis]